MTNQTVDQLKPSRKYPRAPIVEASIHFFATTEVQASTVEAVAEQLSQDYPTTGPVRSDVEKFSFAAGGKRLSSPDEANVVVPHSSGITIGRLAPYLGWEQFSARAARAWNVWTTTPGSQKLNLLQVQFINRIDVPTGHSPGIGLEDYITIIPQAASLTTKPLLGFSTTIILPTVDPRWKAWVTCFDQERSALPGHTSIVIDIALESVDLDDQQVLPMLEIARDIKNDLFERSITDKSRGLFE